MQSNEQAALANMPQPIDVAQYDVVKKAARGGVSKFAPLYELIPNMETGRPYRVTPELGWDEARNDADGFKKQCANVLYNVRKQEALKGYTVTGMVLKGKEADAVPFYAIVVTAKPAAPAAEGE